MLEPRTLCSKFQGRKNKRMSGLILLNFYTSSKGDSKFVQIKHLDGTSSFEPFLQIPRTVGSRGFASPTDAFSLDKHSGNLKIDEYFSKITILKITRQIDLVLRYLANE